MDNVTVLSTAKRHVVKINDININRFIYQQQNTIQSKELISTPVKYLAITCNEYVPDGLKVEDSLKYILTVNGIDYEIVPINSGRVGKKLIRTTEYPFDSDSIIYLTETIKTAKLKILINTIDEAHSPFISNINILSGGE
jgi:hypothetical protein